MTRAHDKIAAGLSEVLAFAQGDETKGRIAKAAKVAPRPPHAHTAGQAARKAIEERAGRMSADNRERDGLNDDATAGLRWIAGALLLGLVAAAAALILTLPAFR